MKDFEYAAPQTEADAVRLLREANGQAEILAGGTDLVGLLKSMVVQPQRVVNIMQIDAMQQIRSRDDGGVEIGAGVTLERLRESSLLADFPAVLQAIDGINSLQLQSQGTLGGEICQRPNCWYFRSGRRLLGEESAAGDNRFHAIFGNGGPAKFVSSSRIGPALFALQATVRIVGPQEDQELLCPLADFFRVPRNDSQRETILAPGQLLTHVILPPAEGTLSATYEVRHGCGPEPPLAAAAAAFTHAGGVVQRADVVLGHVAPVPWQANEAARFVEGLSITPEIAERAGELAVAEATPLSGNQYKVQLAKVAVKRALLRAAGLEPGGF